MRACREYFECKKIIEKIDWELKGKHSDLKSMLAEAKKIEKNRKPERKQGYIQTISRSHGATRPFADGFADVDDDSGHSESESEDSSIFLKKLPQKKNLDECNSAELATLQNTVSSLIEVIGKILKQREGTNLRNELKQITSVIYPRYR